MLKPHYFSLPILILSLAASSFVCADYTYQAPTIDDEPVSRKIVLDSGHSPKRPGASGIFHSELIYNDALVSAVKDKLLLNNRVYLTRYPLQDVTYYSKSKPDYLSELVSDKKWGSSTYVKKLYGRTHLANKLNADLFLSIHHESVQPEYLKKNYYNLPSAKRDTNAKYKKKYKSGFALFISSSNEEQYENSLKFATLFAEQLINLGYSPSNHHGEKRKDKRENYTAVNSKLGIYDSRFRFAVLKAGTMPSVLIDSGLIVDKKNEAVINTPKFRADFSAAISNAVNLYFDSSI